MLLSSLTCLKGASLILISIMSPSVLPSIPFTLSFIGLGGVTAWTGIGIFILAIGLVGLGVAGYQYRKEVMQMSQGIFSQKGQTAKPNRISELPLFGDL